MLRYLALVLCFAACGGSPPPSDPSPAGLPDFGTIYTKISDPTDTLNLSGLMYSRDALMRITAASLPGEPITIGSVPGQVWFVFSGPCPQGAPGKQDDQAVYSHYLDAVTARTTAPVTTQPTPTALGLYYGAQLPAATCFEFVNCDPMGTGVCAFRGFSEMFN